MKLITQQMATSNIKEIKSSGAKADKMIQETALFAIDQVNAHGQTTPMNQLVSALGRSSRKEALQVYLRDFSKVIFNKQNKAEYRKDKKLYNGLVELTIEQALDLAGETAFYDYTKEVQPATTTDALKRVNSLISSLKQFKGTVDHKPIIAKLEELVASLDTPVVAPAKA